MILNYNTWFHACQTGGDDIFDYIQASTKMPTLQKKKKKNAI